jgi:hypothetical protein
MQVAEALEAPEKIRTLIRWLRLRTSTSSVYHSATGHPPWAASVQTQCIASPQQWLASPQQCLAFQPISHIENINLNQNTP